MFLKYFAIGILFSTQIVLNEKPKKLCKKGILMIQRTITILLYETFYISY